MNLTETNLTEAINYFETTKRLLAPVNLNGLMAHNIVLELLNKELQKIIDEQLAYTE